MLALPAFSPQSRPCGNRHLVSPLALRACGREEISTSLKMRLRLYTRQNVLVNVAGRRNGHFASDLFQTEGFWGSKHEFLSCVFGGVSGCVGVYEKPHGLDLRFPLWPCGGHEFRSSSSQRRISNGKQGAGVGAILPSIPSGLCRSSASRSRDAGGTGTITCSPLPLGKDIRWRKKRGLGRRSEREGGKAG